MPSTGHERNAYPWKTIIKQYSLLLVLRSYVGGWAFSSRQTVADRVLSI